jgi:uncharacterized protein (UPF0333 family)
MMSGPAIIGNWKQAGDGVSSRKVGTLGFRKTEYMVGDKVMTAAQMKAAGMAVPQKPMGMGGGAMGASMAGSMAGMAMMSQEKVFGMSGQAAGMGVMGAASILPFIAGPAITKARAGLSGLGAGVKAITAGTMSLTKAMHNVLRVAKGFGPIGLAIGAVFEGLMIYKKVQDDWQDARMGLSMTARAAEQAGVKYFNLQETMQGYIDKQKLATAAAKGSEGVALGMPGLPRSIEELKKAKEEGKGLKDLIESLNRSSSTKETQRLVSNQKAQMVAAGMSIEEANKKIYGALANSNKSKQTYQLLADQGFGAIVDKSTAAEFAVGNLVNTLNRGEGTADWYKEVGNGFEGLINIFQTATSSLIGTKDAAGNVIDEFKAYQIVMSKAEANNPGINDAIGESVYSNLVKTQPLLELIANKSDSIKGILAKWKLFTSGINIDLSKIDSTLASKLAGFTSAIGSGINQLTTAAGDATTYGKTGAALKKLQKTIAATSAAAQRANAASQRSAQEELKAIAKKIKLIEEEKNKKLEALRATQDASNYALELQKLQIEYADAVSRGDQAGAARARLDIDQLTLNRQSDLAAKAIEDAANKAKSPLEKDAEKIQDRQDKKNTSFQTATDNSAVAGEISDLIKKFQGSYNDLTTRGISAELLPEKERAAEEAKIRSELVALIKEIQKSGTGSSTTAKTVRDAFGLYFDKNGKPIAPETTSTSYSGSRLTTTATPNKSVLDIFKNDMAAVKQLATAITGGTTLDRLRLELKEALGKGEPNKPKPNVPTAKQAANNAVDPMAPKGGTVRKEGNITYIYDNMGKKYDITSPEGKKLKKVFKKASGGYISGPGTATSDSIPALLSNGEYVISAKAVQAAGVPMLDRINKMAGGGMVSYDVPKYSGGGRVRFSEGGLASSGSTLYNINVELNGTNLTADQVAASIHKEMRIREMAAGVNRRIGG